MRLAFTKNSTILSKLIRYGLNSDCSHFVIIFDNGIVFHSNLLGSHVQWYKTFVKSNEIVHSIELELPLIEEENIYRSILDSYDGRGYDFPAFFNFAFRAFLNKFFKIKFPVTNKLNSKNKFLCTEVVVVLPETLIPKDVIKSDLSFISPQSLHTQIKEGLYGKT